MAQVRKAEIRISDMMCTNIIVVDDTLKPSYKARKGCRLVDPLNGSIGDTYDDKGKEFIKPTPADPEEVRQKRFDVMFDQSELFKALVTALSAPDTDPDAIIPNSGDTLEQLKVKIRNKMPT